MSLKHTYVLNFVDLLGISILPPLLNPRIISIGGNFLWVGIIASLTSAAQLIGSPIVGGWSDRRGRKPVLLITLFFVLISNSMLIIPSLFTFTIARILFGASHHTATILRTIIADNVPASDVSTYVNKMCALGGLAFMFGPLFGGIIYEKLQNFVYISIYLCAINILTMGILNFYVEEKYTPNDTQKQSNKIKEEDKEEHFNGFKKFFMNFKAVDWSVYGDILSYKFLLAATTNMVFMNMGVILTTDYSFNQIHIGYTFSLINIVMVVCSWLINPVNDIFYKNDVTGYRRFFQGFSVMTVSLVVRRFTYTWEFYIAMIMLKLMAKVLLDSVIMEVLSSRTTDNDRGIIMGIFTSALSLAGLVCPLISGVVGNFMGIRCLTALPIFPAVIGLAIVVRAFRKPITKTD